jgi:hypothetical protein
MDAGGRRIHGGRIHIGNDRTPLEYFGEAGGGALAGNRTFKTTEGTHYPKPVADYGEMGKKGTCDCTGVHAAYFGSLGPGKCGG